MKRTVITLAALAAALGPAAAGLWGNASFSQAVPVRVPASGQVATAGSSDDPTTSAPSRRVPSPTSTTVDDHGGRTPRDQRTEPGDDRKARGSDDHGSDDHGSDDHGVTSTGSSSGRHSGHSSSGTSTSGSSRTPSTGSTADDHGGDTPRDQRTESGDDHGGHGSDDAGGDDHGGHGSDD